MPMTHLDPASIEATVLGLVARAHRLRPATAARSLDITRKKLQTAIDHLEADGLVHVEPHPHDDRSKMVSLTSAGRTHAASLPKGAPSRPAEALSA